MSEKLGNRRVTGLEQYYTPTDLAQELVLELKQLLADFEGKSFLEPAGGTGSFIEALRSHGAAKILSVDTHPMHPSVKKKDFLTFQTKQQHLVTVSNPPFGRNNALSVPFFNHAAQFSSHIAFLVPRSWRKWSVQNRLHANFHLIHDRDVNLIYVNSKGEPLAKSNELRTCFQVWEKRGEVRPKFLVPDNGFLKKVTPEEADIALRVFGYGCGQLLEDFPRVTNTTLMFLSLSEGITVSLVKELDFDRFRNNTAYTQALSLQEINFLLNEQVLGDGLKQKLDSE